MTGCVYKQTDGSWWFILAWARREWAFPFEHGPSCLSEAPPSGPLHHGESASMAPLGTVLVERAGHWCYAGRINPAERIVSTEVPL